MRTRAVLTLSAALLGLACAGRGAAQTPASAGAAADGARRPVCVEAEVNGVRGLSYPCLSEQLAPKAGPDTRAASVSAAEAAATQPSNRLGLFNLSGEQNRFGGNWGQSVQPQRPAPPPPPPR
jgi:hypothetical protein